ncbi:MAG TPA: hypothetical protein PK072_08805 [Quisquiliibacterium sp.]|nr:hypothetical protein [Quisquiliibacterium sp.]HQP66737.1 hypothetical protein [Quisquiliibacterium sp.]
MYIVALAWIYVVLMVSIMQPTVLKGVVTFLGTGLLPLALFLYLMGTPQRRRNQKRAEAAASEAAAREVAPGETAASEAATGETAAREDERRKDENAQSASNQTSDANRPVTPSRRYE